MTDDRSRADEYLARRQAAYEQVFAALDDVLDTFEWRAPGGNGETMGEVTLDRDRGLLVLSLHVRDTQTSEEELVPLTGTVPVRLDVPPTRQVRDAIHMYLCHEADEQMFFNGKCLFDPHR